MKVPHRRLLLLPPFESSSSMILCLFDANCGGVKGGMLAQAIMTKWVAARWQSNVGGTFCIA